MINNTSAYDLILEKIKIMKKQYASLKDKSNDFIFSALCVKNNFYKTCPNDFDDSEILKIIVDGKDDGGVDALLSDPFEEQENIVICQSKFWNSITKDDISDAIHKMVDFYIDMSRGHYENVNQKVKTTMIDLMGNSSEEDDSKVTFVVYTSAPKNKINVKKFDDIIAQSFPIDTSKYRLKIYFGEDILDEIKDAESRLLYVEEGSLKIDNKDNILYYDDGNAIVVNISAFSLKKLYSDKDINLLSRNLRFFIKKKDVDNPINLTIEKCPETFWYKNNGLTIVCENFKHIGDSILFKNFSIVNGGQTTTLLSRSKFIDKDNDFFLTCKIIKTQGSTEEEKNQFSLDIAQATNSQKAIKKIDLKANAPEQNLFKSVMKDYGIHYVTKRGEKIPKNFTEDYLNTDLLETGKLCLAGIFQLPASSRSKPSSIYNERYYNIIFNSNQRQVAKITKDLLYINSYFNDKFIKKYDQAHEGEDSIPFAHNARTLCLAFVALASRIKNKWLDEKEIISALKETDREKFYDNYMYEKFHKLNGFDRIFNAESNYDEIDGSLFEIFETLIDQGVKSFVMKKENDPALNETNYLKNDLNYFKILKLNWKDLFKIINKNSKIF